MGGQVAGDGRLWGRGVPPYGVRGARPRIRLPATAARRDVGAPARDQAAALMARAQGREWVLRRWGGERYLDAATASPSPSPSSRQLTNTSSVRNRCVHDASSSGVVYPLRKAHTPACAIMAPLSMQYLKSMPHMRAPRALHIPSIICCRRSLHPTPPTMSTSLLPVCASARSVISTSIAKMVSCSEKHRSAAVASPDSIDVFARVLMNERSPEKETSMPLTV
mmetsp:Transcript_31284/g.101869  ORF Transcript_31284/g.101869 Transcript_31284/m.101869 type:complete len:223 (+) Transcript_31284:364-1032(+)